MAFFFAVRAQDKQVFDHSYSFVPGSTGEASFVTDYFDVPGKTSNVQVRIDTDLDNSWIYLNLALINADTALTNKMTLYRHFRSKDDLIVAYVQQLANEGQEVFDRILADNPGMLAANHG